MKKERFMSGKGRVIAIKKCSICNSNVEIRHKERLLRKNIFCSKKCEGTFRKKESPLNASCIVCNKKYHVKPSNINKTKTCSMKCRNELDSKRMVGNGNHQYGLKGKKNGSWKSDKRKTSNGYIKIRKPYHPFKDCDGFVLEHHLIAEKYLLNKDNSIMLDGKYYLKKPLVVHHKDENKQNNAPENLMILTRGKHRSLHAQMNKNKK